jgi:hypothetical protein
VYSMMRDIVYFPRNGTPKTPPSLEPVTPLNPNAPDFKIGDRIIVISGKHTHKTKRRTITKVTDTRVYFGTHWALKKDVIK